jgi:RNA polymerase sigma-70 factor (ECF subfamily)
MNRFVTALYLDHIGEIRRYIGRRIACRDTVADLAQETFVRLLSADQTPAADKSRAYLFRIAEHLTIDHYRRQAPLAGKQVSLDDCADLPCPAPAPERHAMARQELRRLQAAIDDLPPRCKAVFLRHKFDGMPQKALAAEYGVTLNAIEKLLIRALLQLRGALQ